MGDHNYPGSRAADLWAGRIVKVASEMGKGIKAFKDGLADGKDSESDEEKDSDTK